MQTSSTWKNPLFYILLCFLFIIASCKTIYICPDKDNDGIPDIVDKCPNVKGVAPTGCPDSDGDGVIDSEDACPNSPGLENNSGCPDSDGDGVPDSQDLCPTVPGPAANNGCPWPDTDGDGVLDKDDKCPTQPGQKEDDGCPAIDHIIVDSESKKVGVLELPPPRPTEFLTLDDSYFSSAQTMKDIDDLLKTTLREKGYIQNKYLSVSNGFALITQMEQIDENGKSVPQENRWVKTVWQPKNENLIKRFFRLLLNAQPGYYRTFLFVVTKEEFSSGDNPQLGEVQAIFDSGVQRIPTEIKSQPFTDEHYITVYVYEFKKLESSDQVLFNINSKLNGQHISTSEILKKLKE